jgi:hypothetical protein
MDYSNTVGQRLGQQSGTAINLPVCAEKGRNSSNPCVGFKSRLAAKLFDDLDDYPSSLYYWRLGVTGFEQHLSFEQRAQHVEQAIGNAAQCTCMTEP